MRFCSDIFEELAWGEIALLGNSRRHCKQDVWAKTNNVLAFKSFNE